MFYKTCMTTFWPFLKIRWPIKYFCFPIRLPDFLELRLDDSITQGTYAISDTSGKQLVLESINSNTMRIDVPTLSRGLYFVTITTVAGTITFKFVKNSPDVPSKSYGLPPKQTQWQRNCNTFVRCFQQTELLEEFKWSAPTYTLNGKLVAGMAAFKTIMPSGSIKGCFEGFPEKTPQRPGRQDQSP